ncbi:MAG: hypothetical protein Q7S00_07410, partial [bacterium]|nr:hypothetical protein [bacterium]
MNLMETRVVFREFAWISLLWDRIQEEGSGLTPSQKGLLQAELEMALAFATTVSSWMVANPFRPDGRGSRFVLEEMIQSITVVLRRQMTILTIYQYDPSQYRWASLDREGLTREINRIDGLLERLETAWEQSRQPQLPDTRLAHWGRSELGSVRRGLAIVGFQPGEANSFLSFWGDDSAADSQGPRQRSGFLIEVQNGSFSVRHSQDGEILFGAAQPDGTLIVIQLTPDLPGTEMLVAAAQELSQDSSLWSTLLGLGASLNDTMLESLGSHPFVFDPNDLYLRAPFLGQAFGWREVGTVSGRQVWSYFESVPDDPVNISMNFVDAETVRLVPSPQGEGWELRYREINRGDPVLHWCQAPLHPNHPVVNGWIERVTGNLQAQGSFPVSLEQLQELTDQLQPVQADQRLVANIYFEGFETLFRGLIGRGLEEELSVEDLVRVHERFRAEGFGAFPMGMNDDDDGGNEGGAAPVSSGPNGGTPPPASPGSIASSTAPLPLTFGAGTFSVLEADAGSQLDSLPVVGGETLFQMGELGAQEGVFRTGIEPFERDSARALERSFERSL